jgi:DNA-binding response OmpR family regulator
MKVHAEKGETSNSSVATLNEPDITPAPRIASERQGLQVVGEIKILVLDDDPSVCHFIKEALANPHYKLDTVSEPTQMEAKLKSKRYQLILMDYVIPGLQPEQIFAWVQKHQPDASIIVVTGYPSIDSALNCLRARTFDYLTKPVQLALLQKTVTHCLESKGLLRMSEEALREALGAVIREKRKAHNMTLAQLAERTKVSLGYLSQIELGKNSASIETLYRISLGIGSKLAELFQAVEERC